MSKHGKARQEKEETTVKDVSEMWVKDMGQKGKDFDNTHKESAHRAANKRGNN